MPSERGYYGSFVAAAKVEATQRLGRGLETVEILDLLDLQDNDRVLEVGSNMGYMAGRMQRRAGCEIVGHDTNPSDLVLKTAQKRAKAGQRPDSGEVTFSRQTVEEANYPDGHFTKFVASHVLEHFEDPTEFLNEAKRITTENATIVFAVPQEKYLGQRSPDHKMLFRKIEELEALLAQHGLEVIDSRVREEEHSIVVATRKIKEDK
ncbi:class I SAM-dependent methyltransferase [Patescibacteria group bacterium]|nr:class I SAM-dependent methyltransferase [Patescibacteria group bacterium]